MRTRIHDIQKAFLPILAALFVAREELGWMATAGLIIIGVGLGFTCYVLDQARRDKKRADKPRTF